MRVVDTISHPKFRIQIFHLNDKYLLEIEAGPMKQTFKFEQGVGGSDRIKEMVDEEFLNKVHDHFNEMYLNFKGTMDRHS